MFTDDDLIFAYTRHDAIADGTLIDVSQTARDAGFTCPVAVTAAVWGDCIYWTPEDNTTGRCQDQAGRLWDVVWMARNAARGRRGMFRTPYLLMRVRRDGHSTRPEQVSLVLDCSPADDGALAVTIGFTEDF